MPGSVASGTPYTKTFGKCVSHSAQHTIHTPLYDMLPQHQITYNDAILPSVLI
jgi:hypothetical protein